MLLKIVPYRTQAVRPPLEMFGCRHLFADPIGAVTGDYQIAFHLV